MHADSTGPFGAAVRVQAVRTELFMLFSTVYRLAADRLRTAIIMGSNPPVRLHTNFGTIVLHVPDPRKRRRRIAALILAIAALAYPFIGGAQPATAGPAPQQELPRGVPRMRFWEALDSFSRKDIKGCVTKEYCAPRTRRSPVIPLQPS